MKDHVYLSKNEFNSKSFCSLQRGRQEFKLRPNPNCDQFIRSIHKVVGYLEVQE